MNKQSLVKLLAFLILLITFISPNQWSSLPIGNTFFGWAISFFTVFIIIRFKILYFRFKNLNDYGIVTIYFIWLIIAVIRGCFISDNYWEWKQLVTGTFALSLPIFVYVFSNPMVLGFVLKKWVVFAIPAFFLFFIWVIPAGAYHFYLGPILLLFIFVPVLKKKWRIILFGFILLMIFSDLGARSQVIKSITVLLISLTYLFPTFLSENVLKKISWTLYFLPVVLLCLGISGKFNIFNDLNRNTGKYYETRIENGEIIKEDLAIDTRTFIYDEVIKSAIKHGYSIWGRTPARGNDSYSFGIYNAENLKTGKYERHNNEVCFANVFTWLGLIGVILYSLLYIKSSYLALYKSNNIFMKLIGFFISFRFFYGWIEDINSFDISNISLWMMISMGYSEIFRGMNNIEFKYWIKSIFIK